MALERCPECDGQVSGVAASCPHCGFPLRTRAAGGAPRAAEVVLWEGPPTLKTYVAEACLLVLAWVALWTSAGDIVSYLASSYWQLNEIIAGRYAQAEIFLAGLVSSAAIARL